VLIWLLLGGMLLQPVLDWLHSEEVYDRAAMQEWLEEARNADSTLAGLVEGYARRARRLAELRRRLEEARRAGDAAREAELSLPALDAREPWAVKREEIYQHLRALGEPPTKMYPGQLPLFPVIYRLEVHFDLPAEEPAAEAGLPLDEPVVWDSGLEPSSGQYRDAVFPLRAEGGSAGSVLVRYQLRAWNKRQRDEALKARRLRQLVLLALAASGLGLAWLMLLQADERESQRQGRLARERIDRAERQRLDEERRRVETERQLLEQRLATQAAERRALELRSNLYASIGIMAGSYAHNIKNLLVRPNDLLRRCLERPGVGGEEERMLREVQQTLATVTERLQQILQTVRRDPSLSELKPLDLNAVIRGLGRTWGELAADRWQLDLVLEPAADELWVSADDSHLSQALENLLFNARDATFEMRNHLRDEARRRDGLDGSARRQALIAAAGWRGRVVVRVRREETAAGAEAVLEVSDNGAGMTEEVRSRCTETHFSTKRDNALYEGHSTGMGLGLSFVVAILENHHARLEIESKPLAGATFRIRFPANEDRS
jgi:signal transduction histidine kinase